MTRIKNYLNLPSQRIHGNMAMCLIYKKHKLSTIHISNLNELDLLGTLPISLNWDKIANEKLEANTLSSF